MPGARPPISLKAQALRWVSQREHSTVEMRGKLLQVARRPVPASVSAPAEPSEPAEESTRGERAEALQAEVDAVIAWLHGHDFLSDARFIESRLHARAAGRGVLRIRRELADHGLDLVEAQSADLHESEFERAVALRQRRFGDEPASTPADQARQYRFLMRRGFAGEVVSKVLRASKRSV